jgi:hypothetical protein
MKKKVSAVTIGLPNSPLSLPPPSHARTELFPLGPTVPRPPSATHGTNAFALGAARTKANPATPAN